MLNFSKSALNSEPYNESEHIFDIFCLRLLNQHNSFFMNRDKWHRNCFELNQHSTCFRWRSYWSHLPFHERYFCFYNEKQAAKREDIIMTNLCVYLPSYRAAKQLRVIVSHKKTWFAFSVHAELMELFAWTIAPAKRKTAMGNWHWTKLLVHEWKINANWGRRVLTVESGVNFLGKLSSLWWISDEMCAVHWEEKQLKMLSFSWIEFVVPNT